MLAHASDKRANTNHVPYGVLLTLAVPGLFVLDLISGQELTASPLYVPIVAIAAWKLGREASLVFALVCAGVGLLADHLLSDPVLRLQNSFESASTPYWNAIARLLVYVALGLSLSALRRALRERDATVRELSEALARVRTLQGLLPICAWCRLIRDEEHGDRWLPLEQYLAERTDASVTHGICPSCEAKMRAQAGAHTAG